MEPSLDRGDDSRLDDSRLDGSQPAGESEAEALPQPTYEQLRTASEPPASASERLPHPGTVSGSLPHPSDRTGNYLETLEQPASGSAPSRSPNERQRSDGTEPGLDRVDGSRLPAWVLLDRLGLANVKEIISFAS